ncbi:hypothetical protein Tco_1461983 [Tanacetum coccineum]
MRSIVASSSIDSRIIVVLQSLLHHRRFSHPCRLAMIVASSSILASLTPQLHESAGDLPSLKLSLHSCSLSGSTNAMGIETSIALVLPAREHECDTSFVLGRPPALS